MKNENIISIAKYIIVIALFFPFFQVEARTVCEIISYAGTTTPVGYLEANGASKVKADYPDMFACIGTIYGSVDATHFNVPNLEAKGIMGYKSGDADFGTMGNTGGEKVHDLTIAELPSHTHSLTDPGHFHSLSVLNGTDGSNRVDGGSSCGLCFNVNTDTKTTGITIANTGSGTDFNVLDPYVTMKYLIAYNSSTSTTATSSGGMTDFTATFPSGTLDTQLVFFGILFFMVAFGILINLFKKRI
jgi:microcystin-dependent protein